MLRPKSDSTLATAASTCHGSPQRPPPRARITASWSGGISSGARAGDGLGRAPPPPNDGHQAGDGEGEREQDRQHQAGGDLQRVAAEAGEHEGEDGVLHQRASHAPARRRGAPRPRASSAWAPWR